MASQTCNRHAHGAPNNLWQDVEKLVLRRLLKKVQMQGGKRKAE
jgi:hypothetical protein